VSLERRRKKKFETTNFSLDNIFKIPQKIGENEKKNTGVIY